MRNRFIRILSVFVCVVMVSVCFMQPIAYANAVAVGVGVVVVVACMLMSVGVSFSSVQQAEAVSSHAISAMPPDLLSRIKQIEPPNPMLFTAAVMAGIAYTVKVSYDLYKDFRDWVNEYFNVNAATVAAGETDISSTGFTGLTVDIEHSDGSIASYPVYDTSVRNDISLYSPLPERSQSFINADVSDSKTYYNLKYFDYVGNEIAVLDLQKGSKKTINGVDYYDHVLSRRYYNISDAKQKKYNNVNLGTVDLSQPLLVLFYKSSSSNSLSVNFACYTVGSDSSLSLKIVGTDLQYATYNETSPPLSLSADAYNSDILAADGSVPIALPSSVSEFGSLTWDDVRSEYSVDSWDFKDSIDRFLEQLSSYEDVLNGLGWTALTESTFDLLSTVDALKEWLAAQSEGADVIDVGALNDALVGAGWTIKSLEDAIALGQAATDAQIRDLAAELELAREEIATLTSGKETEKPEELPETQTGKINWKLLINALDLSGLFPFCIPFDIIDMVSLLQTPPQAPVFEVPIEIRGIPKQKIVIDFSVVDDIIPFVRTFILLGFCIGLARLTSSVIKW